MELIEFRAVNKAAPFLREYGYETGNPEEVKEVKALMNRLLTVDLLCSPTFDESMLFSDPAKV